MKTYRVWIPSVDGREAVEIEARGFTVNEEGQLIFKVAKEGGIVAMFADKFWLYFEVIDNG